VVAAFEGGTVVLFLFSFKGPVVVYIHTTQTEFNNCNIFFVQRL